MSENFNVGAGSFEGAVFSAPAINTPAFTISDSSFFTPATFNSFANASHIDVPPLAGYDASKVTAVAAESQYFQSGSQSQYQVSDRLAPVSAERETIGSGESPRINVGPQREDGKGADILVGKDGTVTLAKGLEDKATALKEYNVQVEAGADSKVTEKALSDLADMIKGKSPDAVPRLSVSRGLSGEDLVSADFRDGFRDKFDKASVDKTLPDDADQGGGGGGGGGGGCDRGGGGGGGGGGCDGGGCDGGKDDSLPEIENEKTDNLRTDDRKIETNLSPRAFADIAGKLGDMHPVQYSSWLSGVMPDNFMEELGPPPWDPKKLAAYLSKHSKEIKDKMGKRAEALDKQGDKEGAKALNEFGSNIEKMAADPDQTKMENFAGALNNFSDRTNSGKASPTDVHAMFDNNALLEGAVRRSQMLENAKKYDTSLGGEADLSKIGQDKIAIMVGDMQRAPNTVVQTVEALKRKGL